MSDWFRQKSEDDKVRLWTQAQQEIAETDECVRKQARTVFTEWGVEGDSYAVPPVEHLVSMLVAHIHNLQGTKPPEGEDYNEIRFQMNLLKGHQNTYLNKENHYDEKV